VRQSVINLSRLSRRSKRFSAKALQEVLSKVF